LEDSRQNPAYTLEFALSSGWALKEKQKFGKKGGGKRISKNVISYLEAYFLAGDINKSEKYTAQEMHNELKELVEEGLVTTVALKVERRHFVHYKLTEKGKKLVRALSAIKDIIRE